MKVESAWATIEVRVRFPKDTDPKVAQEAAKKKAVELAEKEFPGYKWVYYPPFPDSMPRLCGTVDGVFLDAYVFLKRRL